jgi:hypothetical protein
MKKIRREVVNTINSEKMIASLKMLVDPLKIGHKMRVFIDYDSQKKHIQTNYIEISENTELNGLPIDIHFDYKKANAGISREYAQKMQVVAGGGQNRSFYEENMKELFTCFGIKELEGKMRVILDYDPHKAEVVVQYFKLQEDFSSAFLKIEGTKDISVITEENVDYEIENWETTETDSESLSDIEKKILWYIEQDPEKKVIQIRPANDNCILLHGAQEAKYFIEILKESIQQMFY